MPFHAQPSGGFDVALHELEFRPGMNEVPGARANHGEYGQWNSLAHNVHEIGGGREATLRELAAQFDAIRAAPLRRQRRVNRFDGDFEYEMILHARPGR
jgi:hypothetical protein